MPTKMKKYMVRADMVMPFYLIVEAPEGTNKNDILEVSEGLDGSLFRENYNCSGEWNIQNVEEMGDGRVMVMERTYNIEKELEGLKEDVKRLYQ